MGRTEPRSADKKTLVAQVPEGHSGLLPLQVVARSEFSRGWNLGCPASMCLGRQVPFHSAPGASEGARNGSRCLKGAPNRLGGPGGGVCGPPWCFLRRPRQSLRYGHLNLSRWSQPGGRVTPSGECGLGCGPWKEGGERGHGGAKTPQGAMHPHHAHDCNCDTHTATLVRWWARGRSTLV